MASVLRCSHLNRALYVAHKIKQLEGFKAYDYLLCQVRD